ncbi:MAG: sigma-B regulation protein RsbU (phosphoserine phosphatase) [Cyclobacteriaceae bacterium]|jgi:sigma-B regulation protein RsbU (phosphoserine phosphatase)
MGVRRGELLLLGSSAAIQNEVLARLRDGGYEIHHASTEEDCLVRINAGQPEVLLVLLSDPLINLDSTLPALRGAGPGLPIVLLADESSAPNLVRVLNQGADDYLMLPLTDPALMTHVLRQTIAHKREIKRRKQKERVLAKTTTTLLESLQVLERDLQAGFRVQLGMMPDTPLVIDDLTFEHLIVPSLILSGDTVDCFELPDQRLLFYIADVSGHGAAAAIVTVVLKRLFQQLLTDFETLDIRCADQILEWLNGELLGVGLEQHVTLFLGLISADRRDLEYSSAAHFPGTMIFSDSGTQYLTLGGLPLGLVPSPGYVRQAVELPKSFTIVMFSDGVFEILPQADLQEKEKYLISLVNNTQGKVESVAEKLGLKELTDIPDDIALFTVTKAG